MLTVIYICYKSPWPLIFLLLIEEPADLKGRHYMSPSFVDERYKQKKPSQSQIARDWPKTSSWTLVSSYKIEGTFVSLSSGLIVCQFHKCPVSLTLHHIISVVFSSCKHTGISGVFMLPSLTVSKHCFLLRNTHGTKRIISFKERPKCLHLFHMSSGEVMSG